MKKFFFVGFAAVMAIGLSAFTSSKQPVNYFIRPGSTWIQITEAQACPAGELSPCEADNPNTPANDPTQVYKSQDLSDLLRKPS